MILIDDITLVIGITLMTVALVAPFINVMMRRIKVLDLVEDDEDNAADGNTDVAAVAEKPGISIVLTVNDEGLDLKENLGKLLQQKYSGEYQVVVVMTGNDELAENVLKGYANEPKLYTTFIPASSRYMSRKKLAVTVGVKAAKYEWIMLTDVDCRPDSELWLESITGKCSASKDVVMGYSAFEEDYKAVRRFDHSYNIYRQMADAERGRAWGYCGNNLLFRKSVFLTGKGFDGNLKFIRGEYDFIVNKFATESNTAVAVMPEMAVTETELTDKGWRNKNLYYLSTRKHLERAGKPRVIFNATMWMMAASILLPLAGIAAGAATQRWIALGASALALIITLAIRGIVLKKSVGRLLPDMGAVRLLWFEITLPLRNALRMMHYRATDKFDFICHKI